MGRDRLRHQTYRDVAPRQAYPRRGLSVHWRPGGPHFVRNVQITTDGFGAYVEPIERLFSRADYGTEVKVYGRLPFESADSKYSPIVVTDVVRTPVWGAPDAKTITTAHVERNNLTMRMHMRRLTRLTNAFSKKAKNMS